MNSAIAVIGPGAIGSAVAAHLHTAGHQVAVYGRTPRESIEVRPDGAAPVIVPGPVRTDPTGISSPVEVLFLAVKDTQYAAAAQWLKRLCDANTVVCALQNGVEQVERVGRYCPTATVVPAAIWISAETTPQGWVRLRNPLRLVLPESPAAGAVAALFADGAVELDPDFTSAAWHKLLVNAVVGFMVLSGRRSGMFRRDDVAALARTYLTECLAVARADGATLPDAVVDDIVDMLAQSPEDLTTSMLTDREAGRPLEWDIRNEVIRRKAARHGLDTPISDVVVPLLAAAGDGPG
ncbi:oxidoreductase [Mycolicibacterium mageritense]|uniref:oxidoreductase n=1 Tax=Mycolicibacterium mageritense TaxID=53462 RepID=UPI0011D7D545|nr:oxidoreductase [Mycolicibacterium mageritense]TXI61687.1 MAG: oxidoreductase [Mycolicibacterium mageritense]